MSGINNGNSPYRETQERFLPRFSLDSARPPAATVGHEVVAGGLWPPPNPIAEGENKPETMMKTVMEAGSIGEPSEPRKAQASAGQSTGWLARLKRLFNRHSPASVPRLPPMTRRQVQCELSLDDVKVVRNDLKDAEIEVVPFRSSSAPAEHAPFSLRRTSSGGQATFLGRATWRLFGDR